MRTVLQATSFARSRLVAAALAMAGFSFLPAARGIGEPRDIDWDCTVNLATGGSVVTICPEGDSDTLQIHFTALDGFSNPRVGVPADSICIECPGVLPKICADAPTDSTGSTTITYAAGGINPDGWCELLPVTLHAGANTCTVPVASRTNPSLRFFDLNAGGARRARRLRGLRALLALAGGGLPEGELRQRRRHAPRWPGGLRRLRPSLAGRVGDVRAAAAHGARLGHVP